MSIFARYCSTSYVVKSPDRHDRSTLFCMFERFIIFSHWSPNCTNAFVVFVLKGQRNMDYRLIVHTAFVFACPSIVLYWHLVCIRKWVNREGESKETLLKDDLLLSLFRLTKECIKHVLPTVNISTWLSPRCILRTLYIAIFAYIWLTYGRRVRSTLNPTSTQYAATVVSVSTRCSSRLIEIKLPVLSRHLCESFCNLPWLHGRSSSRGNYLRPIMRWIETFMRRGGSRIRSLSFSTWILGTFIPRFIAHGFYHICRTRIYQGNITEISIFLGLTHRLHRFRMSLSVPRLKEIPFRRLRNYISIMCVMEISERQI